MCACARVRAQNCSEHSLSIIDDILFTLPPTVRLLEESLQRRTFSFSRPPPSLSDNHVRLVWSDHSLHTALSAGPALVCVFLCDWADAVFFFFPPLSSPCRKDALLLFRFIPFDDENPNQPAFVRSAKAVAGAPYSSDSVCWRSLKSYLISASHSARKETH